MTLRKLLMASAAVVSLSVAGSSAEAAQPYASIFGGVSLAPSRNMSGHDFTRTTTTLVLHSSQSVEASFKTGFVLGGNAGIEWGNGLRTELELAFRQHKSRGHAHLTTHYTIGYKNGDSNGFTYEYTPNNADVPAHLKLSAWSLMANAWYDFDLGLPITPYVGGGVGLAMVKIAGDLGRYNYGTTGDGGAAPPVLQTINLYEKNDTVFAWQLGVGASMPITSSVTAFIDYRYFAADAAHLKLEPGFHGGSINADFDSHNVMVGLRFNF